MLKSLQALLPIAIVLVHCYDDSDQQQNKRNEVANFDYFKLTLIYPTSVCRSNTLNGVCKVPGSASPWTIHGLWPDRDDGSYPQFCGSQAFDPSQLTPILEKLKKQWPNLLPKKSQTSLWKHEWEKHGTCAGEVPEVNNELKYFNKSLSLLDQLDIYGALKAQGIIPSLKESYNALQLREALQNAYGKNVELHCLRNKKSKLWLLGDIRLCLTKNFEPMDCEGRKPRRNSRSTNLEAYKKCPADGIRYFPFHKRLGLLYDVEPEVPFSAAITCHNIMLISSLSFVIYGVGYFFHI